MHTDCPCAPQGLLAMLSEMHVRYLVLPSMKPVVPMWRRSFGFVPVDLRELAALEDRCACAAASPCAAALTLLCGLLVSSINQVSCPASLLPDSCLLRLRLRMLCVVAFS